MEVPGAEPIPEELQQRYISEGLWNDHGLRDGLEARAEQSSDKIAITDANRAWTFGQLADAVAVALGRLQHDGVGDGSVVLVIAPLIGPAVIAYHAVLRSGGVVIMLDRRSGRADAVNAVQAAGVTAVVSSPELLSGLDIEALGVPTITFDDLLAWPTPVLDWAEPDPTRPIAAVFTSGTTSRPKGVVHSLNTLRSGARNMAEALEVTDQDAAFLSTPLASITGLVQTHLMLDRGASLILEDQFKPAASLARLRSEGATILGGAPVIIEELFKQADREGLQELPLRVMALGGSMIPRAALELAIDRYQITPTRMYGSSEVPCATGTRPGDQGEDRLTNDGAPSRGTEVRAVGDAPGEIQVRGPMRFLGYLNEQDNAEVFAEGGWVRSGDLGLVENDRLTIVGRLKEIVSRKGLKISLTEIDDVARQLPGVQEVAAFGLPDPETGERLVIAVLATDPAAIEFESVVATLLEGGLAKWKLPEQIVLWDGPLPRTESGKVQRRLLVEGTDSKRSLLAPRLR
jgi:acyl-CoA synthetase (AMP-forming)/AMP-acid ligase II